MFPRYVGSRVARAMRPRLALPALLAIVGLAISVAPVRAGDALDPEPTIQQSLPAPAKAAAGPSSTANSSCVGSQCDTVWVGHLSSGPGGPFMGVGVGGVWDFDTDVAGTDSSQGWQRYAYPYTGGSTLAPTARPWWAYDYGNMINEGNTNLWHARDLAGRQYVRHGCVGAWHADDMAGVKMKLNDATEPSAVPITGARSAWCGLRASGDLHAIDALTGRGINGDLIHGYGPPSVTNPDFPGYCNLWDQMMYKDFPSTGTGTVSFRARTDLIDFVDNVPTGGSGWFNPDPTNIANLVINPADSFMVYAGSPNENAYDTNRRWFSEVLDFSKPVQELFHYGEKMPVSGPADTLINLVYGGIQPVNGNIRVVFRVKTNRVRADQIVTSTGVGNTRDGAAVIDQVSINGGTPYGFDSVSDLVARELIPDIAAPGGAWATTGRPAPSYFHIEDVSQLTYGDLCGAVGSSTRICNLVGNVLVAGNHDNGNKLAIEHFQGFESPTIDLAVRTAPPGTKNAQGIDHETAIRTTVVADWDFYPGYMSLDQSIFYYFGGRFYGPLSVEPVSGVPCWSPTQFNGFALYDPNPICLHGLEGSGPTPLSNSIPFGQIDSLRLKMATLSQGWRFGGQDLGDTRGTYWDNFRVGFVRASTTPALAQGLADKYQDQFPVNEVVLPADNAAFDTTTAYVKSARNIVVPINGAGSVPGDSMLATAAWTGDGATTGTRMDLVFRIDPGPGNYTSPGNRASSLVEKDPAHPFWASYLADNGAFGTPGGHGATWNRDVWNSCRMDSAELNYWPVLSRSVGGPVVNTWMGTISEQDPKFAALGIVHNVCFLTDPAGSVDISNTTCSGTAPAAYATASSGAPPAGTTKEGTKIIPDGYLCPGAHVEYFLRRSAIENTAAATLLFDTTKVFPQDTGANQNLDEERWSSFDVLPDMWKSQRYGGAGLACMLMVDGADRRGADPSYRGAADSLGFGRTDGASQGWKVVDPSATNPALTTGRGPNNPAGFVSANLGQYGLSYDHYDVEGAENLQCGHPGARLTAQPAGFAARGDKSGPSAAQLAAFYTTVIHFTGDLTYGTLTDGASSQLQSNDAGMYSGFLSGSSTGNFRALWLAGDALMEDAFNRNATNFYSLITGTLGADLAAPNYHVFSGSTASEVGVTTLAPWAHPGRVIGFDDRCAIAADVLKVVPATTDAAETAVYQSGAGMGPWTASVYRPANLGVRNYKTLLDGFDLSHLREDYATLADVGTRPGDDAGRLGWVSDVLQNHLALCDRRGPVVAVGDLPGSGGSRFADANLGAFPNPAPASHPVTLRFTLASAHDVTIRIYSVAGRELARLDRHAAAGMNAVAWDGKLANGSRAVPGVYFYAIGAPGLSRDALAPGRMILLSAR